MAASWHSSAVSLLTPSKLPIKPILITSSTKFPSKTSRRHNHLRPKILKTLNPKFLKTLNPDPQNDSVLDTPPSSLLQIPSEEEETSSSIARDKFNEDEEEKLNLIETTPSMVKSDGIDTGSFISAKSVVKYGLFLVGAFAFQTVCAVWVMGKGQSDSSVKDDGLNDSKLGIRGIDKGKVLLSNRNESVVFNAENGNVVYLNETEMELKIKEIRVMANEVRELEEKELENEKKKNGIVDDQSTDFQGKSDIEKEIGARLVKVEKNLNSKSDMLPVMVMKHLDGLGDFDEEEEEEEEHNLSSFDIKGVDENLMVKKKYKYKNPSTNPRSKPKGFTGLTNRSKGGREVEIGSEAANLNGNSRESISTTVELDSGINVLSGKSSSMQNSEKKYENERERVKTRAYTDTSSGAIQGTEESLPVEVPKSKNSTATDSQNSKNFTEGVQGSAANSDLRATVDSNASSKHEEAMDKSLGNKVEIRPADSKPDFWWLKLPFVLAILMRRGTVSEGLEGFFSINGSLQEDDDDSYVVTFEDRWDANNFCYLLESFFDELDDFEAAVVPLSKKDLYEAVDSEFERVIVVRKGQLKLYAGQPLPDVEDALRSLIQK